MRRYSPFRGDCIRASHALSWSDSQNACRDGSNLAINCIWHYIAFKSRMLPIYQLMSRKTAMDRQDIRNEPVPSMFSREYWQEDRFSPAMQRSFRNVLVLTAITIVGTIAYLVYLLAS